MNLILTRQQFQGNAVHGVLQLPSLSGEGPGVRFPTLENAAYLIPPGTYRIAVTYSPRFKHPLPLVCNVPVRGSGPATLKEYGVPDATAGSCGGERRNNEVSDEPSESRERSLFRRGIRFHRGTRPEHSKGCILLSAGDEQRLTTLLQQAGSATITIA